jgi:polysaccharide export outer membrane protein
MRPASNVIRALLTLGCLAAIASFSAGCVTLPVATTETDPGDVVLTDEAEVLRPGDLLKISFKGPGTPIPEHEERIPESGSITLRDIGRVEAVGKTRVQLQEDILEKYVPKYYLHLTVTVSPGERFFYTSGDVKDPNRHPYLGELTLTSAISASGGFTDFADKKKILITRTNGKVLRGHFPKALENPTLYDIRILPGDILILMLRMIRQQTTQSSSCYWLYHQG